MRSDWTTSRWMTMALAAVCVLGVAVAAQEPATGSGIATVDDQCVMVGGWDLVPPFVGTNRFRGNVYQMNTDVSLVEFAMEMAFDTGGIAHLEFVIYQFNTVDDAWHLVTNGPIAITAVGTGVPAFYSSGVLSSPIALEHGQHYLLGVTWSTQSIQYNRDLISYPRPFLVGTVVGRVSSNSPLHPMPESLPATTISTTGVYSMSLCLTGACCEDTGCHDRTESECLSRSGQFSAPGTGCSEVLACPMPGGACCFSPDSCSFINRYKCTHLGGSWNEGVPCDDPSLPCAPRGACCYDDGSCDEALVASFCEAGGGTYRGDDVTCDDFPTCYAGACCTDGSCVELTPGDCDLGSGDYKGPGTTCANNICEPVGACCLGETCAVMSAAGCAGQGGRYRGDDTDCDTLTVSCGYGACCVAGAGCKDGTGFGMRRSFCEDTYHGTFTEGVTCETIQPRCTGTCCVDGNPGCLPDVRPTECTTKAQGIFIGYSSVCPTGDDPDPCDQPMSGGACCFNNGQCSEVDSESTCQELAGSYAGGLCANDVCVVAPTGACCVNDACQSLTQADCTAAGGTYLGDGAACAPAGICQIGACCHDDGTCNEIEKYVCDSGGGTYLGAGEVCDPTDLCRLGACCFGDGSCQQLLRYDCEASAGTYVGADVTCDVGTCSACDPTVVSSTPASCLIDARYPHDPADAGVPFGWDSLVLEMSCEPASVTVDDFDITVWPNDVSAPGLTNVGLAGTIVTPMFDGPIPPAHWTCIEYLPSGDRVCLGALPGDVDGSRAANAVDVLELIDDLNGTRVPPLDIHQCDIDRSEACTPADVLGVIDLLNGAAQFAIWNNVALPVCPAAP